MITLNFTQAKETKRTIVFQEDGVEEGERAVVGTLYVQKDALAESLNDADKLVVTIQAR